MSTALQRASVLPADARDPDPVLDDDVSAMFPLGFPQSEPAMERRMRRLVSPFCYVAVDETSYYIGSGFKWNGANIPCLLWPLVGDPFSPDMECAVLLHDFLCGSATTARLRLLADNRFDEVLLRQHRITSVRRWALYRGVRIGAWWCYHGPQRRVRP
jgi:hypothetical protein